MERNKIELLQYHVACLIKSETRHNFFKTFVQRIMPLIRIIAPKMLRSLFLKSREEERKRLALEDAVLAEIKKSFVYMKTKLLNESFLDEEEIKQKACYVETILNFNFQRNSDGACLNCNGAERNHRAYLLPSYAWGLWEEMRQLIQLIYEKGRLDIIEKMVEMRYQKEYCVNENNDKSLIQRYDCMQCGYIYDQKTALRDLDGIAIQFGALSDEWCCAECSSSKSSFMIQHKYVLRNVAKIDCFIFAPSFEKLQELNNSFDTNDDLWIIYESLRRIEVGWKLGWDFLRKKKLAFNSIKSIRNGSYYLGIQSLYFEGKALRQSPRSRTGEFFYSREKVTKMLKKLIEAIYTNSGQLENDQEQILVPHSIELFIEKEQWLCLKVEWIPGIFEILKVHSFSNISGGKKEDNGNIRLKFLTSLIKNPQKVVYMPTSEGNSSQIFEKIGLEGILGKIFVKKKIKGGAILHPKFNDVELLSPFELNRLLTVLNELEVIEWIPRYDLCCINRSSFYKSIN